MKIKQNFSINYHYEVSFTRGVFQPTNPLLKESLLDASDKLPVKVVFVVDEGLALAQPTLLSRIKTYVRSVPEIQLLADPLVVPGGEACKHDTSALIQTLKLVDSAGVDRHAFVIGVGGGAILDMAGFAAAIAHRGIRHIRIPTTVLSQNDSGVGVKNGINYFGKKNFLGTFVPPHAVINDFDMLHSLDDREWRAGTSEAVKVALIKDRTFFEWLREHARVIAARDEIAMEKLIVRCAELHADHISNSDDPFEMGSSRPLDFGHWAAHKLEQLSGYEIRHGEAVAIGIAMDVVYAREMGYLASEACEQILQCLRDLGFDLFHPLLLDADSRHLNPALIQGLEEFREHLGGILTIPMLPAIGEKFDVHEMQIDKIESAVHYLLRKSASYAH